MTETTPTDALLHLFAKLASQDPGFMLSLTLTVGGSLVAGDLINRDRWLDHLEETIGHRPGGQALSVGLQMGLQQGDLEESGEVPASEYHHLHLKNVRYLGVRAGDKNLWRGRISQVSGWSIGYVAL